MPHIRREPFGMVLVPIISFFQLGWMVGWASVPYDPQWGARYPRRWALMSLAGPATNFLLAAVALISIRVLTSLGVFHLTYAGVQLPTGHDFSSPLGALASALSAMLQLNVILGLYNLIPVPPLDGAAVVEGLGPPGVRSFYERARQNPMLQLLGLLAAWWIFPTLLRPVFRIVNLLLVS
jgi:Zn-dependent protease